MPTPVKSSLDGVTCDSGELEQVERAVPAGLRKVPRDLVRNFPHTKRVGSYLVGKMINKGSFAKVMEGMHISTGEKVAIKVIDKKKARQDAYVLKNMKREPRIHQMIRHPNIVLLLETLETENCYYMAMELCAGGDLMDRICERKRLEEREVRRYTRQILSAVDHLHMHGIVHRDLKIENFLLDEHNNIKIVDFGLSNTLKLDSLSPELLNTQCGSPAYAAPELLAHRKYGPKVDVWSVGVSMFAMMTGTLPFTVEPFNIKQLHQKMINGEINTIPSDISKGAVQFVLSLLEPDPVKRPSVKAALEEGWLNEGYTKRPLHTVVYKNRLHPEELNSAVLNYMTEALGYGLSDIIHTVINNKPSTILATYQLLLKKLSRHQKESKSMKKLESSEWNLRNKPGWNERSNTSEKSQQQKTQSETSNDRSQRQSSKTQRIPSQDGEEVIRQKQSSCDQRVSTPTNQPADVFTNNDTGINMETRESLFPEVPGLGERELVHASAPKCPCREESSSKLCNCTSCDAPVILESKKDSNKVPHKDHDLRPTHSENYSREENAHRHDNKLEKIQMFYSEKVVSPIMHLDSKAGQRFKDLLLAIEEKTHTARHLSTMESALQTAPLPRLRHRTLKDISPRKAVWAGLKHHTGPSTDSSPFLVNGSKPPVFLSQRQQALVIKSLRHAKEKRNTGPGGGRTIGIPENTAKTQHFVQLRTQRRDTDLSLPLLPSNFQSKEKKTEFLRLDFS
ncbi:hormonally up-regulated neu tumor-associated kinase homolog A [Ictalurus furcatus]|uniref:hormonally up-regulated neu tumor-associated kinase homolog A n=1 Tax=Ictalurus furcatus TaxID=66913 RepID=UPI0023501231|nr:hormonally up-regulated neu tumor-associated kinase homolog A [Ictalurus furcatus]